MGEKPVIWLHGEVKSPPFTADGRLAVGRLLGRLQDGESLGLPASRPMPTVGPGCHELRVSDGEHDWRVVYYVDAVEVVVLDVFAKTTPKTPKRVIEACGRRLRLYRQA